MSRDASPFTAVTQQSLAEAHALIGAPQRRAQHNKSVGLASIRRWAKSIGDRNPLWLDQEYARPGPEAEMVAPPCWLYTVHDTCVAPKFPGLHVIYGGCAWEFYRRLSVGEDVEAQSRLTGVLEKSGRFCGPMVLQTGETVFSDEHGQPVAKAISRVLRTPRAEAVAAGKYSDWKKHVLTPEESNAIENAYDAEQIRGNEPRYWDDVQEAEALPTIVRGPLTSEEVIQFVGATSPSLGFKQFLRFRQRHPDAAFLDEETGSWESWEASLLRDDVAQRFGFPFAHDAGIDRISWLSNMLTNWMGDHGFLKALDVTLTLPNVYGDATWCLGRVARKFRQDQEHLVELEVWCSNQRAQQTAHGRATVLLPNKDGG